MTAQSREVEANDLPIQLTVDVVSALRADIQAFDSDVLEELIGSVAQRALARDQRYPALARCRRSPQPAATMARVWMMGDVVEPERVSQALPKLGLERARESGLIACSDEGVQGCIDLRPIRVGQRDWWVASDRGEAATGAALQGDHVMGVGRASETLAALTMRTPVKRALDLGSGSGFQSLLLTDHAEQVVATDVSIRAASLTVLNAALNGVDPLRMTVRTGSLFEPVRGEEFDLIVSNPPFVITPATQESMTYRATDRPGDRLTRELVDRIGDHLVPGGRAQLLANLEIPAGTDAQEVVTEWISVLPLDAWVIIRDVVDVAQYAETWLRDGGLAPERDRPAWEQAYAVYLSDFADRNVAEVAFLAISLQRCGRLPGDSGSVSRSTGDVNERVTRWQRVEELTAPLPAGIGAHLADVWERVNRLRTLGDVELRDHCLRRADDVIEERYHTPGQADPVLVFLKQGAGFGRRVQVDSAMAAVVGACDGDLPLGVIVDTVVSLMELAPDAAGELIERIHPLIVDGLVELEPEVSHKPE